MAKNQPQGTLTERMGQAVGNTPAQAPASPAATIQAYFKKIENQIAEALPKHMNIERMTRIALTTIRTNPKLLECTLPSLAASVLQAAQLGLEPGLLGHCYLIPFKNNKDNTMEVQFIIGYKGMIDLARRSGQIQSIAAHIVYENDFIELEYGLDDKLKHVPWHLRTDKPQKESGLIKGSYMVAKFKDGGHYVHYMPIHEIYEHRDRSNGYQNAVKWKRADTPWMTDEAEMCKKTVIRSGFKYLPISVEIASAVDKDEKSYQDVKQVSDAEIIDITASTNVTEGGAADPEPPSSQQQKQEEVEFE